MPGPAGAVDDALEQALQVQLTPHAYLDGFIAPEERVDDPDMQRWMAQWMELQQWIFPQRFFRENLKLGEGGEEGRENDIVRETFERTGASVMGKRMFDLGEQAWPQEAPFHTPVFVVTHDKRDPWERPGGTTFHFVNDGIEPALDQAREAARDRDVRIAGGGATILEYVNAGLIDEFRHWHENGLPCIHVLDELEAEYSSQECANRGYPMASRSYGSGATGRADSPMHKHVVALMLISRTAMAPSDIAMP
jgi:dihydrofolate reductase